MSLNAFIRDLLERTVRHQDADWVDAVDALPKGNSEGWKWNRGDLYDV